MVKEHLEISYRMRRDCWGTGLATEAARACRDYGFKKAGLRRLISIIELENAASIRVAEKTGMTLEKSASFHGVPVLMFQRGQCGDWDSLTVLLTSELVNQYYHRR